MSETNHHRPLRDTYFFTLRLARSHDDLLIREIEQLRRAMRDTLRRYPFHIDAVAVLPNALHTLWTLPEGDSNCQRRVAMLKSRFSRMMPMPVHRSLAKVKRAEKGIWQRSYWEHKIVDAVDLNRHRDLIHLSPVHAGLCSTPQDWLHSSVHRDVTGGQRTSDADDQGGGRLHLALQTQSAAHGAVVE